MFASAVEVKSEELRDMIRSSKKRYKVQRDDSNNGAYSITVSRYHGGACTGLTPGNK